MGFGRWVGRESEKRQCLSGDLKAGGSRTRPCGADRMRVRRAVPPRTRTSVPKTSKFRRTVWLAGLHLLGHRGKRGRPLLWPHVADEV